MTLLLIHTTVVFQSVINSVSVMVPSYMLELHVVGLKL